MISRVSIPLLLVAASAAACGPSLPTHRGYGQGEKAPWSKPKRIILDERNEGEAEGVVNYPTRQRAQWFMVMLPENGSLKVTMSFEPLASKSWSNVEVEVLDEGFNVLSRGDEDEDNAKKERAVEKVRAGKHYVHVYTIGKLDHAEFTVKVAYTPRTKPDPTKQFPWNVAMMSVLHAVPPADDTPRTTRRTDKPKDTTRKPKVDKPVETGEKPVAGSLRGSIAEFGEDGGGVRIVINKGEDDGVEAGWRGYILGTKTKKRLPGSDFTVKTVRPGECEGTVRVSADEVQANRSVVLLKGSD